MVSGCTAVVHIQAHAKPDARAAATAGCSKSGAQQGFCRALAIAQSTPAPAARGLLMPK